MQRRPQFPSGRPSQGWNLTVILLALAAVLIAFIFRKFCLHAAIDSDRRSLGDRRTAKALAARLRAAILKASCVKSLPLLLVAVFRRYGQRHEPADSYFLPEIPTYPARRVAASQ
jgi:hypothetical protein